MSEADELFGESISGVAVSSKARRVTPVTDGAGGNEKSPARPTEGSPRQRRRTNLVLSVSKGAPAPLRPLLVVPGLFQTEIVDAQQGHIWGRLRNLYGGPPIATLDGLRGRPGGIVRVIPIVPGLYNYDLMLSLERALCGAGYRVDETLHYFAYDWRLRIVDLGAALAAEVRRIAERTGGPIDMLGLSNGGPMVRAAFAADRALPVERVVTSGGPHGGAVETLACLDRGFQFAPLGRTVSPQQFMACPGALQAIPSPAPREVRRRGRRRRRGERRRRSQERSLRDRDVAPHCGCPCSGATPTIRSGWT